MPTIDDVDIVLQRVAILAMLYYPEIHFDEPHHKLDADVDWCLAGLRELPGPVRAELHDLVARTIVDPTARRQELCTVLYALGPTGA